MFDVVVRTKAGKKLKGLRCPINECGIGKARDNLIQIRGWRIAPYHAALTRLPELLKKVRALEKRIDDIGRGGSGGARLL